MGPGAIFVAVHGPLIVSPYELLYINPNHPGMPSLLEDVKAVAVKWDNIDVGNNQNIKLNLNFVDETTAEPHVRDDKNVVGWKCLRTPDGKIPLARTRKWMNQNTGEIVEADIAFNYYRTTLEKHSACTSSDHCVKDTAMHEWGHFAGLEHVEYKRGPSYSSGIGNCAAWEAYTMHKSLGPNTHDRETIECEDKFALEHIYGK